MAAISLGRLDNAEWLIRHGADVNAVDENGNSPLISAMIACSDQALVTRLIKAGARAHCQGAAACRPAGRATESRPDDGCNRRAR